MAVFEYRASDRGGSLHQGMETASDLQAAARALRSRGLTPIVLTPSSGVIRSTAVASDDPNASLKKPLFSSRGDKVTAAQVLRLTSELGLLLHAGLPLDRALKVQIDTAEPSAFKAMVEDILQTIKSGRSFTMALEQHAEVFSGFYVSMVRSGEASGNLAGVLTELAVYLERSKAVRSTIVSAMVYPAIQRAILDGADANQLRDQARDLGMETLFEDGMRKVRSGMTSIDEVLRVTQDQIDLELG